MVWRTFTETFNVFNIVVHDFESLRVRLVLKEIISVSTLEDCKFISVSLLYYKYLHRYTHSIYQKYRIRIFRVVLKI